MAHPRRPARRSAVDARRPGGCWPSCSIALIVETSIYSTITPLLPDLADDYGLSKAGAGHPQRQLSRSARSLVACPPAALAGAHRPAADAAHRALASSALASLGFALADCGGAAGRRARAPGRRRGRRVGRRRWPGSSAVAPRERRVEAMGTVIGAAIAGALGGPVLGAVADAIGRGVVFAASWRCPLVLIVALARLPRPELVARGPTSPARCSVTAGRAPASSCSRCPRRSSAPSTCWCRCGSTSSAPAPPRSPRCSSSRPWSSPRCRRWRAGWPTATGRSHPSRRGLLIGAAGVVVLPFLAFQVGVAVAVVVAPRFARPAVGARQRDGRECGGAPGAQPGVRLRPQQPRLGRRNGGRRRAAPAASRASRPTRSRTWSWPRRPCWSPSGSADRSARRRPPSSGPSRPSMRSWWGSSSCIHSSCSRSRCSRSSRTGCSAA